MAATAAAAAVSFSLPSHPRGRGPRRRSLLLLRAASTAAPPSPDLSIQLSPRASPPAPAANGAAAGPPVAASFARDRAEDLQAEARAMARAAGATVYTPELLAARYGSRPFKARARTPIDFEIIIDLCSFARIVFWLLVLTDCCCVIEIRWR
jgi:hypothetical protein